MNIKKLISDFLTPEWKKFDQSLVQEIKAMRKKPVLDIHDINAINPKERTTFVWAINKRNNSKYCQNIEKIKIRFTNGDTYLRPFKTEADKEAIRQLIHKYGFKQIWGAKFYGKGVTAKGDVRIISDGASLQVMLKDSFGFDWLPLKENLPMIQIHGGVNLI